jgi:hypothetical protein
MGKGVRLDGEGFSAWEMPAGRLCCIEHAMAGAIAYASYVNFPRSPRPEDTAATLQRAAQGGLPVLIPGALEKRVGRPTARPPNATAEAVTPHAAAAAVDDRERLEHEREGGGAPSERTGMRHRTFLTRLSERLGSGSKRSTIARTSHGQPGEQT